MTLNPYSCIWGSPLCDGKRVRNSAFCNKHKVAHRAEMANRKKKEAAK